jgi:hypothetical protein
MRARQYERWKLETKTRREVQARVAKEKSDQEKELLLNKVPLSNIDKQTPEYNTLKLKNYARECDRYKASNREGAKLANALLKDLKIVTKKDCSRLICPGKLRRERLKWGGELEKAHSAKTPLGGLYSDGKKCPTLVRDTYSVQVQVMFV